MGCFPACFRHWKHKQTIKNVQHQCLSPSHEAAKLLPATTESLTKEEIVNDKKMVSQSEGKCEEQINTINEKAAVVAHSNVPTKSNNGDKLGENQNGEVAKEMENYSEPPKCPNRDLLINEDSEAVKPKEITSEQCPVPEESSDSLFSLSIDSRKQVFAADMGGDREVSSPFQMNTTQLKYDEDKENLPLSKNPMMKQSIDESKRDHRFTKRDGEKAVETSLSSWLVASGKSPTKTNVGNSPESEKNYGDRRVLGAVAAQAEIKAIREPSSGGSTPCCSGDEQLGIGTVGRYWRQRGRNGEVLGLGPSCKGLPSVCNNA